MGSRYKYLYICIETTLSPSTASKSDGAAANLGLLLVLSASLCPIGLVTVRSKDYDSHFARLYTV